MERFLHDLRQADAGVYVIVAVGAVLLVFGRRLYWLALGALGFWLGLLLVHEHLNLSRQVELGAAFLAGVAGAVLAIVAQKLAITIGGFFIGGLTGYFLAQPWARELDYQIWWIVLLGAIVGVSFASFLFDAALIVVSSVAGATLVAHALPLTSVQETWTFIALVVVGVIIQSRQRARRPPKDDG